MGSSIPLVALGVQPPPREPGPLDMAQQGQQISNLRNLGQLQQQQIQSTQLENQQRQEELARTHAINEAYKSAMTVDAQGQQSFDTDKLQKALVDSGKGSAVPAIMQGITEYQKSKADLTAKMQAIQEGHADLLGHMAYAIKQANYDPILSHRLLDTVNDPQVAQIRNLIDTNPQQFHQMVDTAIAQSPAQQKEQTTLDAAKIRAAGAPKEGELPLPNVDQMNQGLATRYQVLNPNKPLPAQFTLPASATQKDFDRIDKLMSQTEQAQGTKAQQDTATQIRLQTLELAKQAHADSQAQHAAKPVLGFDANNRAQLLPEGDAKAAALTGITEATPKQIDDAKTHTVVLNDMQTKLNDVVAARGALDQGEAQRLIISKVLSHSEPGMMNDAVKSMALKGATQQTKDYIQSVLSLKESGLGLPKEITGGSRVSETQSSALFQTLPSGSSADGNYALSQAKKFQANIDRLRERVPNVRGLGATDPHPDLTGKGTGAAAATGGKTYTQSDVEAAVAAHPGTTAAQIEAAFKAKNYTKQ